MDLVCRSTTVSMGSFRLLDELFRDKGMILVSFVGKRRILRLVERGTLAVASQICLFSHKTSLEYRDCKPLPLPPAPFPVLPPPPCL